MRTQTKLVCWCVAMAVTLMMCAGCAIMTEFFGERKNEITRGYYWITADGKGVICVEQKTASTNNALKACNVYVIDFPFVQRYRIENRKVSNCRWADRLNNWDRDQDKVIERKLAVLFESPRQYPNRLRQTDNPSQLLESDSVVTMTEMGSFFGDPISLPGFVTWGGFGVHQWMGTPSEVPEPIEQLRQGIEQVLSTPEHIKHYKSYLRAVPLFTKEEIEAEKDTPLIDEEKMCYHVQYAMNHPYVLFPLSGSPFKSIFRKYTPGDKFKVQYYHNSEAYFLIETFKKGETL